MPSAGWLAVQKLPFPFITAWNKMCLLDNFPRIQLLKMHSMKEKDSPLGIYGSVWRHFWLSHLRGRGSPGRPWMCQTCCHAQISLHNKKTIQFPLSMASWLRRLFCGNLYCFYYEIKAMNPISSSTINV